MHTRPRLYSDLADWFHLLTAPHEYHDEAEYYGTRIIEAASGPVDTVLELGSGGGNNAVHMKRRFAITLSDLSPEMLAVSQRINPELEHRQGDMRSLRITGGRFDAVFVHDAVSYLASEAEVRAMAATAAFHCRPYGSVLVVPDHVRELFTPPYAEHGGHDAPERTRSAVPYVDDGPRSLRLDLRDGLCLPPPGIRRDRPRGA